MTSTAEILTRNFEFSHVFIAHHYHVPDQQIKREQLGVIEDVCESQEDGGGGGGGDHYDQQDCNYRGAEGKSERSVSQGYH